MTHRILVVDDEPDITGLVAYHLARIGYQVSTATNGQDALKAAREERPDLVVLDLMLPGVSGYEVLQELRKRKETRDVGIILLTARREEVDRVKGLALGADDYLTKPFSPQELTLRVAAVLRRLAAPAVRTGRPTGLRCTVKRSRSRPRNTSCWKPWSSGAAGCRPGPSCSRWSGRPSPTSRPGPWTCTCSGSAASWGRRPT